MSGRVEFGLGDVSASKIERYGRQKDDLFKAKVVVTNSEAVSKAGKNYWYLDAEVLEPVVVPTDDLRLSPYPKIHINEQPLPWFEV